MRTCHHRRQRRALYVNEVIYSVGILGLMTFMTIDAVTAYCRTSDQYAWRQAALWAATGQLQRYQAGAPLDSTPPEAVVPEQVKLKTDATPAAGDWAGFDRVTVTATVELPFKRMITERVTGYVRKGSGS